MSRQKKHPKPTAGDYAKLVVWLQENRERLLDERPPYRMVAAEINPLGINCKAYAIEQCAKELGIVWVPRKRVIVDRSVGNAAAIKAALTEIVGAMLAEGFDERRTLLVQRRIDTITTSTSSPEEETPNDVPSAEP